MSVARTTLAWLVLGQLGCGVDRTAAIAPDAPLAQPGTAPYGAVVIATSKNALGANLSGLVYEPSSATADAVLWAVQNQPSKLYRLTWNGSAYAPTPDDGWITGKLLRYPTGEGSPDSEGLTRTDWTSSEIYVVAERDNDAPAVPRQSILRYELGGTKGVVAATHEWVLTQDLPPAEANQGLEGIAWLPDSYLVENGFFDEATQALYTPSRYPAHGSGIFLVGRDDSETVYGYVLDHEAGSTTRVVSFSSAEAHSVDLTFDRDTATLWSLGGRACAGRMTVVGLDTDPASATLGHFIVRATVAPPPALADMSNEGIAIAPLSECSGGRRSFFWADDGDSDGYAIRKGSIACDRPY